MAVRKIIAKSFMIALSGAALMVSGLIFSSNSEDVLRDSFAVALQAPAATKALTSDHKQVPIAGSEEYWLESHPKGALPITRTISIGDRIALRFGNDKRNLVVSSVSEFTPPVTQIDTRAGQTHLLLVTAREANNRSALPVRFLMEVGTPPAELAPPPGRVL